MKKILCILQLPPPIGGVTVINQHIIDSPIINSQYKLEIIPLQFTKSIKTIGTINSTKIFLFINVLWQIFLKLIKDRYGAAYFSINLTGIAFYRDLAIVLLLKLFHTKIIYHLHGKGQKTNYTIGKNNITTTLYRWAFNNTHVVMISPLLYPEVSGFISEKQISYLPNAIIPTITDTMLAEAMEKKKQKTIPQLFFLGHMWKLKGVYVLVEALSLLNKSGIEFYAKFVGTEHDISANDFATKLKEMNLTAKVEYCGPKYGQEKTDLYLQSDIFVFPTLNDAFGIVNIEAMEAGLPVISSIEGAIPEIIDDGITGYLVPKYDIAVLSDKIKELIKNPNLRINMGKEGRKKFLATYTIDKFENGLSNIFDTIIKKHE